MKKLSCNLWKRLIPCMGAVLLMAFVIAFGNTASARAAEEIPISSVEDLMNMESNPSGSYYLTKDITLPKNMQSLFTEYAKDKRFSGTLDGRGHKLKNYTFIQPSEPERYGHIGIFGYVENATFKNLSLTNVNININRGRYGASVGSLVWGEAYGCKFDNIKVSGKITIKSNGKDNDQDLSGLDVGGLINISDAKITNCSSSLKINVDGGYLRGLTVGGLAGHVIEKGTVKNCSFSGDISVSAKIAAVSKGALGKNFLVAGICGRFSYANVYGCTNSGNVTFKMQKNGDIVPSCGIGVYGIGGGISACVSSCGNTGKISISAPHIGANAEAAGLVGRVQVPINPSKDLVTKCWNKGSVSADGEGACAGGLCISAGYISQCYNKGAVFASTRKVFDGGSEVGGICVSANRMKNCYNVGKVSLKGAGSAGGLANLIGNDYSASVSNYSTGTVSAKGGQYLERAALFPKVEYGKTILHPKCNIYDNYYTASTGCSNAYDFRLGNSNTDPRATKVSSITAGNCPKLSSKYWTYSSKYKRMILKNNKEK